MVRVGTLNLLRRLLLNPVDTQPGPSGVVFDEREPVPSIFGERRQAVGTEAQLRADPLLLVELDAVSAQHLRTEPFWAPHLGVALRPVLASDTDAGPSPLTGTTYAEVKSLQRAVWAIAQHLGVATDTVHAG